MACVSALRFAQRHTIAATSSFVLLTAVIVLLTKRGLLGDWPTGGHSLRSAVIAAFIISVGVFFPVAAVFDLAGMKRRQPVWLAPLCIGMGAAAFLMVFDPGSLQTLGLFLLQSLFFGSFVALTFCSYWIPLRFIASRTRTS